MKIERQIAKDSNTLNAFNPLTAEWTLRALIDFTLSNVRRFYSSMGNPLDGKGLKRNGLDWRAPLKKIIQRPYETHLPCVEKQVAPVDLFVFLCVVLVLIGLK